MKPCPRCRCKTSLEDLKRELWKLEERKKRLMLGSILPVNGGAVVLSGGSGGATGSGGAITITGGTYGGRLSAPTPIDDDLYDQALGGSHRHTGLDLSPEVKPTVCSGCGYHWTPDAPEQAAAMLEKIRQLKWEVGGPVEALGDLARDT